MVLLFIRARFYILLVFIAMYAVFWLFWLSYQYLPSDWLERFVCVPILTRNTNLPEIVISATTTDTFKRLDKFWQHQDILYDYKAELTGVGNRSQINTDDNIVL